MPAIEIDAMVTNVDHLTRIFDAEEIERREAISQLHDCFTSQLSEFEAMSNSQLAAAVLKTFSHWHYIGQDH